MCGYVLPVVVWESGSVSASKTEVVLSALIQAGTAWPVLVAARQHSLGYVSEIGSNGNHGDTLVCPADAGEPGASRLRSLT